ncbi:MAG TPA: hypothetical protein VFB62_15495, partial [Polyangiaceae bacterium]|nr:hypothetical protein [Polyangiaceae bacterium]
MAKLSFQQRTTLEGILGMRSGYVLDLSDRTFGELVKDSIGIDPYESKYAEKGTSKANRLRTLWDREPESIVAKLLNDIIAYGVDGGHISVEHAESGRSVLRELGEELPLHQALRYPAEWRFGAGPSVVLPPALIGDLMQQVLKITGGVQNRQDVLEVFKQELASASGASAPRSTSFDWAETDLRRVMDEAAANGATFIDGFWSAIVRLKNKKVVGPNEVVINRLLTTYGVPLAVQHPHLVATTTDAVIEAHEGVSGASTGLGRYTLREVLGRGGYGVVHRATRETSFGTFEFALKLLDPSPFQNNREKAEQRFRREVAAMLKVQHRGLVQYLDAGIDHQG